ncbi:GDSL esterase/lipase [Vitis vinifera]|uniref:GDSL esterase/lipase n=1 Tax=Vitis vinifera TaxID=29760 RepID=A0A438KKG2_VITVI|nr:GDSL esterase/lipase [Vitis vinifera]
MPIVSFHSCAILKTRIPYAKKKKDGNNASPPLILLLCLSFLIKSQAKHVPALYIFGDSLVDSGNNNEQKTLAKADYAPYGIDYVVGTTAAESLNLQQLPPFLDHTNIIERSSAGYNFASASAGILPETGTTAGECRVTCQGLSSWFSIGSNDYAVNYLVPQFYNSSRMYNPEQFAQLLVNELGNHLQEMYGLGGRKFVVFEVGPIGCLPAIALKRAGPKPLVWRK